MTATHTVGCQNSAAMRLFDSEKLIGKTRRYISAGGSTAEQCKENSVHIVCSMAIKCCCKNNVIVAEK
jgi:hypothetical protein